LGRADDVFISGGEKVSLSSVSEKLEERYSQNNWCALAVTDLKWGQRLVVAVAGVNPPSHEEVTSLLGDTFGNAAKPKQYLIFETFPLIGIGKIDRIALSKRAEDEFHG
jgi:acyl-CoA synthetase (AMP-forming)/AMP-acid ligase II